MPQILKCRECGDDIVERVGRGLCRPCWNVPEIRFKHPPVASFGGREASRMGNDVNRQKLAADKVKEQPQEGPPKKKKWKVLHVSVRPADPLDDGADRPLPEGKEVSYETIRRMRRRHSEGRIDDDDY